MAARAAHAHAGIELARPAGKGLAGPAGAAAGAAHLGGRHAGGQFRTLGRPPGANPLTERAPGPVRQLRSLLSRRRAAEDRRRRHVAGADRLWHPPERRIGAGIGDHRHARRRPEQLCGGRRDIAGRGAEGRRLRPCDDRPWRGGGTSLPRPVHARVGRGARARRRRWMEQRRAAAAGPAGGRRRYRRDAEARHRLCAPVAGRPCHGPGRRGQGPRLRHGRLSPRRHRDSGQRPAGR